jgi:putative flavoprotein involved in K+ transport
MTYVDSVVIGGGQAGLAAGYHLQRAGGAYVVLEAGEAPVGSWAGYYKNLVLFSPARHSSLPGLPFPGDPGRYPGRDEVVAYLAQYVAHHGIEVRTSQRVTAVRSHGSHFLVRTTAGTAWSARRVINATGSFSSPYRPKLPGLGRFAGQVLHSAEYELPEEFGGRRVVVVGAGNSAVQIAVELAAVARVTLASREPIKFLPQRPLGRDIHDWIVRSGVDALSLGTWFGIARPTPVLDDGRYRAALAAGQPDRRPMFRTLTEEAVVWSDGTMEPVEVVLLATGFRPTLPHLAGLGALKPDGRPLHRGGVGVVPGLGYVGLEWQRSHASATIRGVGRDAAYVLRQLDRQR